VTLHIVLGDGYMPTKELTAHLVDMQQKAAADDDGFWFTVQAKPEPTDTDRALIKWLNDPKNGDGEEGVYWDAIGDEDSADKLYADAQVIHKATKLGSAVVKLMDKTKAGGELDDDGEEIPGEDADLLALYFSDEEDAEEDRWLNDVISAVADAGYPVYALNDGMTLIEPPDEDEDDVEDEAVDADVIKAVTAPPTREQLSEMELDDLKKIALERGIEVAPRSRKPTYIDAILGEEDEVAEVEIEKPKAAPPLVINTTGTVTTGTATSSYVNMAEVSGPAMIIVVYDGRVVSRVVTTEQARALLS